MSRGWRRAAIGAALVALAMASLPALAGTIARAVAPVTAGAGSWGAAAGPVEGPPVRGSDYVVRFAAGNPTVPPTFFDVFNTGSLGLRGQTYKAINVKPTSGSAPPTVALDACVGGRFDRTTSLCIGGTVVRLTTTNQDATAAAVPIAAGGSLSVRASPTTLSNYPLEYQTIVTITVARSQVAAATTRTS